MCRSSAEQKEREAAIKRRQKKSEQASGITVPISQVRKTERNKKAGAILRRLQRDAKKPECVPPHYNKGTVTREKEMKAAGIESSAIRTPIKDSPLDRAERHDSICTTNSDEPFEPQVNISKGAASSIQRARFMSI